MEIAEGGTSSGVWLLASCAAVDAFPDDLEELAAQFFTRFPAGRQGVAGRCTCAPGPRDVERVLLPRRQRSRNSTAWSASGGGAEAQDRRGE